MPNAELAARVGLTAAPCSRRVQRLEADGVITGYHARIAPEAEGRAFEVLLNVDLERKDRRGVATFEERAASYPEVVELRRMFGLPDYFMRVRTADLDAYEAFLTRVLEAVPGVRTTDSHITMKVVKADAP